MVAKFQLQMLLVVAAALCLTGCRGATPEEVGEGVAGFAGDVLYNSAGAQNQANRDNAYPQPCLQCEGLGYHPATANSTERSECHACMGRGWN